MCPKDCVDDCIDGIDKPEEMEASEDTWEWYGLHSHSHISF